MPIITLTLITLTLTLAPNLQTRYICWSVEKMVAKNKVEYLANKTTQDDTRQRKRQEQDITGHNKTTQGNTKKHKKNTRNTKTRQNKTRQHKKHKTRKFNTRQHKTRQVKSRQHTRRILKEMRNSFPINPGI